MTAATKARRRHVAHAPAMALGDQVAVKMEITGRIVARSFGGQPHVDIVAPDGTVWRNIPTDWVEPSATVVRLSAPVSDAA